jgi:hypothetical protein
MYVVWIIGITNKILITLLRILCEIYARYLMGSIYKGKERFQFLHLPLVESNITYRSLGQR